MQVNVTNTEIETSSGIKKKLGDYSGKVLLVVNVASYCGNTPQYSGLQDLQNTFSKNDFAVLAFPCNDFGGQEPGTLAEIKEFCSVEFGVEFEIFSKVHAKGDTTEPYTTLNKANPAGDVTWNFEKFLIDKNGNVIGRFQPGVQPSSKEIRVAIQRAIEE